MNVSTLVSDGEEYNVKTGSVNMNMDFVHEDQHVDLLLTTQWERGSIWVNPVVSGTASFFRDILSVTLFPF